MPKAALNATALNFFNWRALCERNAKECFCTFEPRSQKLSQFTESNFSDVSHYCFTEHVEQFWQSSFIGMESTPRIRAFQSNNSGPTPKINDCFNTPNHTSPNANKLPTHKNFQSQHFQCFLSIRVIVNY